MSQSGTAKHQTRLDRVQRNIQLPATHPLKSPRDFRALRKPAVRVPNERFYPHEGTDAFLGFLRSRVLPCSCLCFGLPKASFLELCPGCLHADTQDAPRSIISNRQERTLSSPISPRAVLRLFIVPQTSRMTRALDYRFSSACDPRCRDPPG